MALTCFAAICATLERTIGFSFWNAFFAAWDITETFFWMFWLIIKISVFAVLPLWSETNGHPVGVLEVSVRLRCGRWTLAHARDHDRWSWTAGCVSVVAHRRHPSAYSADLAASYAQLKTLNSAPHDGLRLTTITVRYALRSAGWTFLQRSDDVWFISDQPGRIRYRCYRRLNLELLYARM